MSQPTIAGLPPADNDMFVAIVQDVVRAAVAHVAADEYEMMPFEVPNRDRSTISDAAAAYIAGAVHYQLLALGVPVANVAWDRAAWVTVFEVDFGQGMDD